MAKKNAKFSDTQGSSSLLFDGRTGAVMAVTSQEDLRQKVQAVREVVPSRSNNDIVLVLQYYDGDVDRATQAFLEDGAKEALDNWHFSGNKPAKSKKKKSKNKSKDIPSPATDFPPATVASNATVVETPLATAQTTILSPLTTGEPDQHGYSTQQTANGKHPHVDQSLPSAAFEVTPDFSKKTVTNTEAKEITKKTSTKTDLKDSKNTSAKTDSKAAVKDPKTISGPSDPLPYMNGIAGRNSHHSESRQENYKQLGVPRKDGGGFPSTDKIAVPNTLNCGTEHSLDNGLSMSSTASSSLSTSLESSPINNHTPSPSIGHTTENHVDFPTTDKHVLNNHSTIITSSPLQGDSRKETSKEQRTNKDRSKLRENSSMEKAEISIKKGPPRINSPALQRKKEASPPRKPEKGPNSPLVSRKGGSGKSSSKKTTEGSKIVNVNVSVDLRNKGTATTRPVEVKPRERNISEVSVSSTGTNSTVTGDLGHGHKDHRGLEKSMKDLQRQVISLQRHRNILQEECEKGQKSISKVFSDLKESLIEREATMMYEMDQLKTSATEVLMSRQCQGKELRIRADHAFKMSDQELVELRADIKHFVSDRKIDEDIASQNKFQHNFEQLSEAIKGFGDIQTLKYNYSTRRPSVSSVSSGMTDPLSPLTPQTPSHPQQSSPLQKQPAFPTTAAKMQVKPVEVKHAATAAPPVFHHGISGAKVVSQSDSVTQFETSGEMQALLQSKKDNQLKSNNRRSQTPAGRGRNMAGRGGGSRGGQTAPQRTQKNSPTKSSSDLMTGNHIAAQQDEDLDDTDTSSTSTSERKSRNIRRRQKQRERQKERKHMSRSTSESSVTTANAQDEKDHVDSSLKTQNRKQAQKQSGGPIQPSKQDSPRPKNNQSNDRSQSPTKNRYNSSVGDGNNSRSQSSRGRYGSGNRSRGGNRSQSPTKRSAYNPNYRPNENNRSQSPTKGNSNTGQNSNKDQNQSQMKESESKDNHTTEAISKSPGDMTANASTTKDSVKFSDDTKKSDAVGEQRNYGGNSRGGYNGPSRGRGNSRSRSKSAEKKRSQNDEQSRKKGNQSDNGVSERKDKVTVNNGKLEPPVQNGIQTHSESSVGSETTEMSAMKKSGANVEAKVSLANGTTGNGDGIDVEPNLVSSNNNNNKSADEDGHSFNRDDHCYDENGGGDNNKALPQRKPRGRLSRKTTEVTTVVSETTIEGVKMKGLKINGEMNGVSQEHRWSNEELDMIS